MSTSSNKTIALATIGTLLEWAEFTYYAYIAVIISKSFFPQFDQRAAILATFALFAIGYVVRPLGAILFGYIGDNFGRKLALQLSILQMGIATIAIAFIPSYQSIGIAAPILLLLCRCLQGLAVSGEFNGSAIYLIEHAQSRPCLAGSWTGCAAAFGMLIGSLMAALVSLSIMPSWAWRLPFLIGAIACYFGLYSRRNFIETPAFEQVVKQQRLEAAPLLATLKEYPAAFFKAMVLATAVGIFIYVLNIYYVTYLISVIHMPTVTAKLIVSLGTALVVLIFPFAGILADQYGVTKIMRLGLGLTLVLAPLLFIFANMQSLYLLLCGQILYALCDALVCAPMFKYLNDLFPTPIRYSAISLAWSLSMAFFGGTAPIVAALLQDRIKLSFAPGLYVMLPVVLVMLLIGKKRHSQNESVVFH